jgi:hypothetical protein
MWSTYKLNRMQADKLKWTKLVYLLHDLVHLEAYYLISTHGK